MKAIIRDRLDMMQETRRQHVRWTAYPGVEDHHEYHTGDGEASFKYEDDAQYYERLTGHIEELEYLSKVQA